MSNTEIIVVVGEQDFPGRLVDLRVLAWPVQCTDTAANLYLNATVVAKADFGELGHTGDWQDVYVTQAVPLFQSGDVLVRLCPAFLSGGIERQETSGLFDSDDWGLAIDQAPGPPPAVLPPHYDVDAWWQDTQDPHILMLSFRIRNKGQCQLPDVCLSFEALLYRPSVHSLQQPDFFSARFTHVGQAPPKSPVSVADAGP